MHSSIDTAPVFARWQREAEKHWQSGDYAWMAGLVGVGRVLEIGSGAGFSTLSLVRRGCSVMTIEPDVECRAMTETRIRTELSEAGDSPVKLIAAEVGVLSTAQVDEILGFAPETLVCWLMGAKDEALDKSLPEVQRVPKHREFVHRQVAELAARLPSVQVVQLVDRTAFPWKIKDSARETMAGYHAATSFSRLPFVVSASDAIFRKLDERYWPSAGAKNVAGMVPVLGAVSARRSRQID